MTKTRLGVLAVGLLAFLSAFVAAQESASTLTELQRVRAELHQTKVTLIQTQTQLANCQAQAEVARLTVERAALETDFRTALKPAPGAVFDWQTLTFRAPAPAVK